MITIWFSLVVIKFVTIDRSWTNTFTTVIFLYQLLNIVIVDGKIIIGLWNIFVFFFWMNVKYIQSKHYYIKCYCFLHLHKRKNPSHILVSNHLQSLSSGSFLLWPFTSISFKRIILSTSFVTVLPSFWLLSMPPVILLFSYTMRQGLESVANEESFCRASSRIKI